MKQASDTFLGFAVLDARRDTSQWAVWLVGRSGNANAVVLDARDPKSKATLRSLATGRVLVGTDGSVATPASTADIEHMIAAALDLHAEIVRCTKASLPAPVAPIYRAPSEGTPVGRALALANHVGRAWSLWLGVEAERVKRIAKMPENLRHSSVRDMPPR